MLHVERVVNNPIDSNCFIVFDDEHPGCLIIDPGCENPQPIEQKLAQIAREPQYALLTHEHFDHIWSVPWLKAHYPALRVVASGLCSGAIVLSKRNMSLFYNQVGFALEPADLLAEDIGHCLPWNGTPVELLGTPGHTQASICIGVGTCLFTGDTLIKGHATVTKLPTGSAQQLSQSLELIRSRWGATHRAFPGHGEVNIPLNLLIQQGAT